MSLTIVEIEDHHADAKRLAGANWHTLPPADTTKAIVLTGQRLLAPAVREPGGNDGYLRCEVGRYLGPA